MTTSEIAKALLELKLKCLNTPYCGDCPFGDSDHGACGLSINPWGYDE